MTNEENTEEIIDKLLKNENEDIPLEKEDVKEVHPELSPEEKYIQDYDKKLQEKMGWTEKDEVETY